MATRRDLYVQIQMLSAGERVADVWGALVDSLASAVAFSATDRPHAQRLLDLTRADLERAVDDNWAYVREVKAKASTRPGRG